MTQHARRLWRDLWDFLEPRGSSLRVFIGLYMVVQGAMRVITGGSAANINVFTARTLGALMLAAGLWLLLTLSCGRRKRWSGRLATIYAAAIWLLLITAAWPAQAWVSISGAIVFVLALGNEVRVSDC